MKITVEQLQRYDPNRFTLIPLYDYKHTTTRLDPKTRKPIIDPKTKKPIVTKDGKRPRHRDWTTREYGLAPTIIAACAKHGWNAGVRLKKTQIVFDVDPRNGGKEGWAKLCADLDLDDSEFPHVITGSGGSHFYATKPGDVLVRDTLEDYPGVEFKSHGRQVVAAGSIHPDTLEYYAWDEDRPALRSIPAIPDRLLNVIARPQRDWQAIGGGQVSQEQLERMLEAIPPEHFAANDPWLHLMMACHHATAGAGRAEFIRWSISDPKYANSAEKIGRRWDSLDDKRDDGITGRTLNKILRDHGASNMQANLQSAESIADDFETFDGDEDADILPERTRARDDLRVTGAKSGPRLTPAKTDPVIERLMNERLADEDTDALADEGTDFERDEDEEDDDGIHGETDEELNEKLEDLNRKYCAVVESGKFKIIYQETDPAQSPPRDYWVRMAPADFMLEHCNVRIERSAEELEGMSANASKTAPLGKMWIEWPHRRKVKSVLFDPMKEHPGHLNLWTGFAYKPQKGGSWEILRWVIEHILCNGDKAAYEYVMNWMRWLIQFPDKRAEVCVVFKGKMGVGKGTLGNVLCRLIGRHAMSIASSNLITGRFNAHLQDCIFLFADEAVRPGDHDGVARLKNLITEPMLAYEGKGRDVVMGKNYLHVMMASNDDWVIPADKDERRYMVSDCAETWMGPEHKHKWEELHAQLTENNDAGYKQMMWDLSTQHVPEGWTPRNNIPMTAALIDQKIRNLNPLNQFFYVACQEQRLKMGIIRGDDWASGPVRFFVEDMKTEFAQWCRDNTMRVGSMGRSNVKFLVQEVKALFPGTLADLRDEVPADFVHVTGSPSDNRAASIQIPSIADCRAAFEKALGGAVGWMGNNDNEGDFG